MDAVPWEDPHALVKLARARMTEENFREAGEFWMNLVSGD